MKIEHITLGGTSAIRDTGDILLTTLRRLGAFRLPVPFSGIVEVEEIPGIKFNVTLTEDGAMFNIEKEGQPAIMNACCFSEDQAEVVLGMVRKLARSLLFTPDVVRKPALPKFLVSVPVAFFMLSPEESILAGEIEFYIWYQLYLSWKKIDRS